MIAHQIVYAISLVNFGDIFTGRTGTDGWKGVKGERGSVHSTNARRLHSATMTNLIAAFRGPPDNYDDTLYSCE
jgi:hypothetical protein